jgi:hypothetical protein
MTSTFCRADQQRALLSEVAQVEAEEAALFARKMVLRAAMDELWNPQDGTVAQEQFGVIELAGTARIGQGRASTQLIDGTRLREELPLTLAALRAGSMYRETAVLLLQQTRNCSPEVTRELERRALPTILRANTTDVRRLLAKLIPEVEADLDPELTKRRLDDALADRDVTQHDRGNGITGVLGTMGVIEGQRWSLADERAGIVRTAAQRRAEVFSQLPSRFLALVRAIQRGEIEQLLAIAQADPDLADDLEALAATLPFDDQAIPDGPEPVEAEQRESEQRDAVADPAAQVLIDEHGVAGTAAWDELPEPTEPPPDWAREPDPPDASPHWTELSWLELASTILGLPVNNPTVLNAHIPMTTLLELDNRAGTVEGAGGGALPAHHARMLLPTADLRRVFIDPDSGIPIGIDPTIYRAPVQAGRSRAGSAKAAPAPTDSGHDRLAELLTPFVLDDVAQPQHDPSGRLRRFVELRDQHCTGIGCSQPAGRCHLDHETAYPDGPTAAWNLGAKSARCHRAKHAGWTVTRHGPGALQGNAAPGSTTWTSPLGHSYTRLSAWHHVGPGRATVRSLAGAHTLIEIDAVGHRHAA